MRRFNFEKFELPEGLGDRLRELANEIDLSKFNLEFEELGSVGHRRPQAMSTEDLFRQSRKVPDWGIIRENKFDSELPGGVVRAPCLIPTDQELQFVGMNEFAVSHTGGSKTKLATFGLGPCVGICGYDSKNNIGFLAHVNKGESFFNSFGPQILGALNEITDQPKHFKIYLVSGHSDKNSDIVKWILGQIDMKRGTDLTFEVVHVELGNQLRGHSLALDLCTGRIGSYKSRPDDHINDDVYALAFADRMEQVYSSHLEK